MGLRFLDGGRDFPAVDCWGLVCLVFRHEQGIELPPVWRHIGPRPDVGRARDGRRKIGAALAAGHAALPRLRHRRHAGLPRHGQSAQRRRPVAGVLTAPGRLLHIEAGQGVHHVPLDHFSVKSRLILFRRHEALT